MSNNIIVPVTGKLYWVEVWFRDNSSNPEGSQVVESETKVVRTVSISRFNESTKQTIENTKQSASASATIGASYSVVSASVTTEISASKEITDTYSFTVREQKDISTEDTVIDKTKYEIKAHGKLGLYQAYFSAPGVDVSLNQTRTGGSMPASQDVELNVEMQEIRLLADIKVVYRSHYTDRPFNCIHEIGDRSEDINCGFGGDYVFLNPIYTNQVDEAITTCRIRIQKDAWRGADLASGAGGDFRYLDMDRDVANDTKYMEAALLRRSHSATIKDAPGFDVLTIDINQGRHGDWLYLAFKTRKVFKVEKVLT
ncbi:MAG: hypothetical protein Q9163_006532 [Psora crenata]